MSRDTRMPLAGGLALLLLSGPAAAKVFLTTDEALKLAFPGCEVERKTVYLSKEEVAKAAALSKQEAPPALVNPYEARCGGQPGGTAYFDVHKVRTLAETIMIVVAPDGRVRRIEVLTFNEPEDYLPKAAWYAQFVGRALDDELALKQGIRAVAGATLTARATTDAVRRVLAVHRVVQERGVAK